MNKFKFGDKVWHEEFNDCVVLEIVGDDVRIVFSNEDGEIGFAVVCIKDLQHLSDWVKCSERMPDFNIRVLVHDGQSTYVDFIAEEWDGYGKVFFHSINRATHWMPLPTPPQD